MSKAIKNRNRQSMPMQHIIPATGELSLRILLDSERVVVDDDAISQYMTDLQTAGHLSISDSSEALSDGFTS